MALRDAFVRALRSAAQAFVALVIVTGVPAFQSLDEVKAAGIAFGFAAVGALFTGIIAFVTCFAEDNTKFQLPK